MVLHLYTIIVVLIVVNQNCRPSASRAVVLQVELFETRAADGVGYVFAGEVSHGELCWF